MSGHSKVAECLLSSWDRWCLIDLNTFESTFDTLLESKMPVNHYKPNDRKQINESRKKSAWKKDIGQEEITLMAS